MYTSALLFGLVYKATEGKIDELYKLFLYSIADMSITYIFELL